MKKLFAILLLFVYLFNLTGYSLWFQHLITKSDSQFTKQLDNNNYSNRDLVEVKVPLNMPYISNSGGYERADGQLEYNGIHYNYVKRKVSNDTLYILCLPNISKTQLCNARAAYSKDANDIPSGKKTPESSRKAGFDTDHCRLFNPYAIAGLPMASAIKYPLLIPAYLYTAYIATPEQPPKAAC